MSKGNNKATSGSENSSPNKGETQPRTHQGGPNSSNKKKAKHEKDDSSGSDRNTTKKQGNSI